MSKELRKRARQIDRQRHTAQRLFYTVAIAVLCSVDRSQRNQTHTHRLIKQQWHQWHQQNLAQIVFHRSRCFFFFFFFFHTNHIDYFACRLSFFHCCCCSLLLLFLAEWIVFVCRFISVFDVKQWQMMLFHSDENLLQMSETNLRLPTMIMMTDDDSMEWHIQPSKIIMKCDRSIDRSNKNEQCIH